MIALLTQLANIYYFLSLFFCCSEIFLDASFLSTYPLKASLENSRSLANVASLSTKRIMYAKPGYLKCLCLIFMKHLFRFSLVFQGNFDSTKHISSGVSRTFQTLQCSTLTLPQEIIKFRLCCFICWFKLFGFDFLAVGCQDLMRIYTFPQESCCFPTVDGCWIQCLIISLVYPEDHHSSTLFINFFNLPQRSSIFFSTTSSNTAIK